MTEDELIRQAQAGDKHAFASLLDNHYQLIYRFAYRWCGNQANAEDVTQLACIKLARCLCQFTFKSAFSTWLYRLVVNCAKDWQKSESRHSSENASDLHESEGKGHTECWTYLNQVLTLMDQFADGFKETALLVFAEGHSHAEVAAILNVKESTISWRIHQIRQKLHTLVQEGSND